LRVLDGAVGVFCAVGGVEPQSETVWRQGDRYGTPRIAFVNKMDRVEANFEGVVEEMRERLGANAVPVQIPIGAEDLHRGAIDLITMKAYVYKDDTMGAEYILEDIPEDLQEAAKKARHELIERVAENDESIMELYIEDKEPDTEKLIAAIRKQTVGSQIVLCYAVQHLRTKGFNLF